MEGIQKTPLKTFMYSDFDCDQERTILDATAIQRTLVGLDATAMQAN